MRQTLSFAFTTVFFLLACSGASSGGGDDGGLASSGSSSSSGTSGASGASSSSGTPGPGARMIVTTNGGSDGACLPFFNIGSFEPPRPIDDNTKDGDRLVRVLCTVAPSGGGYLVHAAAVVDGLGSFSFHVDKVPASGNVTGSPSEVAIGWGPGDSGYGGDGNATCTADTTFSPSAGIAPGRYWASFSCSGLKTKNGAQTCAVSGQVRFENCAQAM